MSSAIPGPWYDRPFFHAPSIWITCAVAACVEYGATGSVGPGIVWAIKITTGAFVVANGRKLLRNAIAKAEE